MRSGDTEVTGRRSHRAPGRSLKAVGSYPPFYETCLGKERLFCCLPAEKMMVVVGNSSLEYKHAEMLTVVVPMAEVKQGREWGKGVKDPRFG